MRIKIRLTNLFYEADTDDFTSVDECKKRLARTLQQAVEHLANLDLEVFKSNVCRFEEC